MASKEQEIKMINYFANNLDRLREKDTDKPYKEMKTKFKFRRSVSFLRDRFLNSILPNLFKYECLDNETMVNFYDRAGMEIPDELVAMIDAYCKLHCAQSKKQLDTISISSSDSEDDLPTVTLPKQLTTDLDQSILTINTDQITITQTKLTDPDQSQQNESHLKTNIYKHAPGKRDFDTISISSTDSADDLPPTKLPKQQNCQLNLDPLPISNFCSLSISPINKTRTTEPDQSAQKSEIHLQQKTHTPDPDQLNLNHTKEIETQTDVTTPLKQNQTQVQIIKSLTQTKTNRDQSTETDPSMITQIEQKNMELNQFNASEMDVTHRNQFIFELDNSSTDSNISIISLNTRLGFNTPNEIQQNSQTDIDEDQLRLIEKYMPLTHLDQYKTYQFESPRHSPIQAIPDQSDSQFNVTMDLDVTPDLSRSQIVQTSGIITENKCIMTDPQLNHISDWHLISAEGTIDGKWGKLDHFFIPKSAGHLVRCVSEKYQIPDEQIHSVDETNFANMLEFKTLKAQCENLLWPKSKRKNKKLHKWIREFHQNDSNIQIIQKDPNNSTKRKTGDEIPNTPIVTRETFSGYIHPKNIYETKMAKNSDSTNEISKNSDISIKTTDPHSPRNAKNPIKASENGNMSNKTAETTDHGNNSIKTTENGDISINSPKNSKNPIKASENGNISIETAKTTDHGNNSIKTTGNISINSTENGTNLVKTSQTGIISIETTKITSPKSGNHSDISIESVKNSDNSIKITEIGDISINSTENGTNLVKTSQTGIISIETTKITSPKSGNHSDISIESVKNSDNSIKITEIGDDSIKTSENLNLSVDDDMNSSKNSESIFYTAEGIEADALNSSPVLNNRKMKRTEKDINESMEVSEDSASNMLFSIDSEEISSVNNQIAAGMSENSSIFLPSEHNTDKSNDTICDESITLSVNNKNKKRELSEEQNTINKLSRLKLNKSVQTNLNTNKHHKVGNNSNDQLSIEDEGISPKTSENNEITRNKSNDSSPSNTVTSTAISDKKCESVTLFKPLKSTKNKITTKLKLPDLSPSKSNNIETINQKSIELSDFFSGNIDAVMNFIATPNQKMVTSTQIERSPLKSLGSPEITHKQLVRSKSPRNIINDSVDDVMNYIKSPSHNIVTSTQIDVSPHNNSNMKCIRNLIDNMNDVQDHSSNENQNINAVSGNCRVDPILAQNSNIIFEKPRVDTENSNKCTQNEVVPQNFSDNSNKVNVLPKNVNSTQNKQSAIAPYILDVNSDNLASTSRFVTNCVIDPNANNVEKDISQRTNSSVFKYSKETVTGSSNEYSSHSSLGTVNSITNVLESLKNHENETNKRKTPETYAFAQSSKDNSKDISTTLSVRKMQEIFNAIQCAAIATAQDFQLPREYKLRTPQFDKKNVKLKTPQEKALATDSSSKLQNKPDAKPITSKRTSESSIENMYKINNAKSDNGLFNILVPKSKSSKSKESYLNLPKSAKQALLEEYNKIHYGHMYKKYDVFANNIPEHAYAAQCPVSGETSESLSKSRQKRVLQIQTFKNKKSLMLNKICLESKDLAKKQSTRSPDIKLPLPPKNDSVITNTSKHQVTATHGQPEPRLKIDTTQCDSTTSPTAELSHSIRLIVIPNKLVPQYNKTNIDQKVSDKPESLTPNAKVAPLLIRRNSKTKWDCIPILPEETKESVVSEQTKLKDNSQLIDCLNRTMNESIEIKLQKDVVTQIDKIAPNANQTVTSTNKPETIVQNTQLSPVNVGNNLKTKCPTSAVLNSSEETRKLNDSKLLVKSLHNNTQIVPLRDNCLNPTKRHRTINESSNTPATIKLQKDVVTQIDKIAPNANQTVTSTNKPETIVQNTQLSPVNVGSNLKTICPTSAVLNSSEETRKDSKLLVKSLHNNTQLVPLNCLNPSKRQRTMNESNNIPVKKKQKIEIQIAPNANETVTSTKKPETILKIKKLSPVNVGSNLKTKCLSSTVLNSTEETNKLNDSVNTKLIVYSLQNNKSVSIKTRLKKDIVTQIDNMVQNANQTVVNSHDLKTKLSASGNTQLISNLQKKNKSPLIIKDVCAIPSSKLQNDLVTQIDKSPPNDNQTVTSSESIQYMELTPVNIQSNLKTKLQNPTLLNSLIEAKELGSLGNTKMISNLQQAFNSPCSMKDICTTTVNKQLTINKCINTPIKTKLQNDLVTQIDKSPTNDNQTVTSSELISHYMALSALNIRSNLKTKLQNPTLLNSLIEAKELGSLGNTKKISNFQQAPNSLFGIKDVCTILTNKELAINKCINTPIKTILQKDVVTQIDNSSHIAPNSNQTASETILQNVEATPVNLQCSIPLTLLKEPKELGSSVQTKMVNNFQQSPNSPFIIKDVRTIPSNKQIDKSPHDNQTITSSVNLLSDLNTKFQCSTPIKSLDSSVDTRMISNWQQASNSPFIIRDVYTISSNNDHTPIKTTQQEHVTQIDKSPHITSNQTITTSESIVQNVKLSPVNLPNDLKTWQCFTPLNSLIETREFGSSAIDLQQASNSSYIIKDACTIPLNRELAINKYINTISAKLEKDLELILEISMSTKHNDHISSAPALSNYAPQKVSENTVILIKRPNQTTIELNSTIVTDKLTTNMELIRKDAEIVSVNDAGNLLITSQQLASPYDALRTQTTKLDNEISKSAKNNKTPEQTTDELSTNDSEIDSLNDGGNLLITTQQLASPYDALRTQQTKLDNEISKSAKEHKTSEQTTTELNSTIDELSTNIELILKDFEIDYFNDSASPNDALRTQTTKLDNEISKTSKEHKTPEKTTTELNSADELNTYMPLMLKDPRIISLNDGNSQPANLNDELRTQNTKLHNEISKTTRKRTGEELDSSTNSQLLIKKAKLLLENETNWLKNQCTLTSPIIDQTLQKVNWRKSPELRKSNSDENNSNVKHFEMKPATKMICGSLVEPFEINSVCISDTNASAISPQLTCLSKENYNSEQSSISCASSSKSNKTPLICDKFSSPNSSLWTANIVSDSEPSTPESRPISIQKAIEIKQNIIDEYLCRELPRSNSPIQLNTIVSDWELRTPGSGITPIPIEIKQEIMDEPQLDEHLYRIQPRTNQPIIPVSGSIEIKQEQLDESLYAAEQGKQLLNAEEIKEEIIEPLAVFSQRQSCEHLMSKRSKMAVKKLRIDTTHLDVKRIVSNIGNVIDIRFEKEEIDDVTVNPIFEVLDTMDTTQ